VRVIACLTVLPNIIHSDSPGETLSGAEWKESKAALGVTGDDALVIVWGDSKDVETAVREIAIRAKEVTIGIPSETRQALRDGTTGFERILPGPQRMYPDTDLPPLRITPERIERLKLRMPVQYWDRIRQFHDDGLPADAVDGLAFSPLAALYDYAREDCGFTPVQAAVALWRIPRRLRRKGIDYTRYNQDTLRTLFAAVHDGRMTFDGIGQALRLVAEGRWSAEALLPRLDRAELAPFITRAREDVLAGSIHDTTQLRTLTLDRVMDAVRGRIPGADVAAEVDAVFAQEVQA